MAIGLDAFVAEQNHCPRQNVEATKYHARADQKNGPLLSSGRARSTRIKQGTKERNGKEKEERKKK